MNQGWINLLLQSWSVSSDPSLQSFFPSHCFQLSTQFEPSPQSLFPLGQDSTGIYLTLYRVIADDDVRYSECDVFCVWHKHPLYQLGLMSDVNTTNQKIVMKIICNEANQNRCLSVHTSVQYTWFAIVFWCWSSWWEGSYRAGGANVGSRQIVRVLTARLAFIFRRIIIVPCPFALNWEQALLFRYINFSI